MAGEQKSFWGDPQFEAKDVDTAYFVELIRTITKDYGRSRSLQIATSAMQAITAFVIHEHGPREALALLDRMRNEVTSD